MSLKPSVAYRVPNSARSGRKAEILPSLAYAGIPYQVFGDRVGALDDLMGRLPSCARFRHILDLLQTALSSFCLAAEPSSLWRVLSSRLFFSENPCLLGGLLCRFAHRDLLSHIHVCKPLTIQQRRSGIPAARVCLGKHHDVAAVILEKGSMIPYGRSVEAAQLHAFSLERLIGLLAVVSFQGPTPILPAAQVWLIDPRLPASGRHSVSAPPVEIRHRADL